jgi:hypothetical protein
MVKRAATGRWSRREVLAVGVGFALSALPIGASAQEDERVDIVVVVNEAVPAENLSLTELREFVQGTRRFWSNGHRVELIVEAGPCRARTLFVETLSGMTELQYRHYWAGQVFNQRATQSPRSAPDRRLALALVAAIPGALAVVEDGPIPAGTRRIRVNDREPGDTGYPLR